MPRSAIGVLLSLFALVGLAAIVPAHGQGRAAVAEDRQILVMLDLAPAHFRPGGSYAGSYGDAQSNTARRRIADAPEASALLGAVTARSRAAGKNGAPRCVAGSRNGAFACRWEEPRISVRCWEQ